MHPYTTTATDRTVIVRWLTITAVGAGVGLGVAVNALGVTLPPYIWLPSPAVVFAALFFMYDSILWRQSVLGMPLSKTPDLNGNWVGTVRIRRQLARTPDPDLDALGGHDPLDLVTESAILPTHACRVAIKQSWSRLSVQFETDFSRSVSIMASIGLPGEPAEGLRYVYRVEPFVGAEFDIELHDGLARLRPQGDDWSRLTGDFFSDQHYQRYGEYSIERVPG